MAPDPAVVRTASDGDARRWRVEPDSKLDLDSIATDGTPGAPGDREATEAEYPDLKERLGHLQDRLWAEGNRSLLVILQAMDAGGKDGTIKHVFAGVNPMGVQPVSFKAPTHHELAHDFLWRVHREVPARGEIGLFNRSQYEDVLIVRVEELVPESVWRPRYRAIADFERTLAQEGTVVVKLYLHISADEQAQRFRDRLEDPDKNWKFSTGDLAVRAKWDQYREAYTEAIERTSTEYAPWYVVPADRKWYRNWAVSRILIETLEAMDPQYPPPEPGLDKVVVE